MDLLCRNSSLFLAVNYFLKKATSKMFDFVKNALLVYKNTWGRVSWEKDRTSVLHFDKNFRRNFWMKKKHSGLV